VNVSFRRAFSNAPWESQIGYCRAVRASDHIYVTGTAPVDDAGGVYAPGDAYAQARRCFEIIQHALRDLGADLDCVVRTRMFVTDISRWAEFGRAHQEFLGQHPPATTMVEVKSLIDPAMLIEIETDAVCPEPKMPVISYIVNVEAAVYHAGRYLMIVRSEQDSYLPGALGMPGGKVEDAGTTDDILEQTIRREVWEEAGVQVAEVEYVESHAFGDFAPCVDVVFLCRYQGGTARVGDPDEVAAVHWMTPDEIAKHPDMPPWTRRSIELAEKKRLAIGW
jgi:isochorismate pyruvate lyase